LVKVIGTFTLKTNNNTHRRRFESSIIAKTALTEEMIVYYKKIWSEEIAKKFKEKSHVS